MLINASIFRASEAVSALATRGTEMTELHVPWLFGTAAARLTAGQTVARAATDAERAAQLLEQARFPKASVDSVREAAAMLQATPLKTGALHDSGATLHDVATRVLSDNAATITAARTDLAHTLVTTAPDELTPQSLADLAALSTTKEATDVAPTLMMLTERDRAAMAAGNLTTPALKRLDAARLLLRHGDDVAAARAEIPKIVQKEATTLTPDEWRTLRTFNGELRPANASQFPMQLAGYPSFHEVSHAAANGSLDVEAADRYLTQWRFGSMDTETLMSRATQHLDHDPRSLSADDWQLIEAAHRRDPKFAGMRPEAEQLVRDGIAQTIRTGNPTGRLATEMMNRYVAGAPVEARRDMANALISRYPATYTTGDWDALSALLAADPSGADMLSVRYIPGLTTIDQLLSKGLSGKLKRIDSIDRFVSAWRMEAVPFAERRTIAAELISRDPDTFTRTDWTTLRELLDSDPNGAVIKGPRTMAGAATIQHWIDGMLRGEFRNDGSLNRYFHAWKAADMPPNQLRDAARALAERSSTTFTTDDWAKLNAIVLADADGSVLGLPLKLADRSPLGSLVNSPSATSTPDGHRIIDEYMSAWNEQLDPRYSARFADAVKATIDGTATDAQLALISRDGVSGLTRTSDLSAVERNRFAAHLMTNQRIAATRESQPVLNVLRETLVERTDLPEEASALRDETVSLLDSNISRLNGKTLTGDVWGYGNHPDYAQIGAIRGNLDALDMMARQHATPTDTIAW